MVLGKLPVPGRPTYLDDSGCEWGLFGHFYSPLSFPLLFLGWSGGAMVLGKLPVPGRPIYLDDSGCGLFGHF